ncbi:MAG: PQQ-binding-like beta-propeller repeat protein [Planctomycetaceae bacterium]|nr:PQQ-binding-like beta-propeller repeat protein [Planctomycetaceae bacterium]
MKFSATSLLSLSILLISFSVLSADEKSVADRPGIRVIGEDDKGEPTITAYALSPDGKTLVVSSEDGLIQLLDVATLSVKKKIQDHRDWIAGLAFSPDGKYLASHNEGENHLKVRDLATGKVVEQYDTQESFSIQRMLFTKDGSKLIASDFDGYVYVWDRKTSELLWKKEDYVESLTMTPDEKYLAVGKNTLRYLDLNTGEQTKELEDFQGSLVDLSFIPQKTLLVAADSSCRGSKLHVWDMQGFGESVGVIDLGRGTSHFSDVVTSPDGRFFVSSDEEGTLRIFDTESRTQLNELPRLQRKGFKHLEMTPDGKTLIAGSRDERSRVYLIDLTKVFE